ncbi:MAG: hypothetical protein LBJ11_09835 [Oscillospiraceae bacterium]|jgi:hypothetical protein|nr:hypothetical protein [Oscillospiraceae bacterium]
MLEILVLVLLIRKNLENGQKRGQSKNKILTYTLGLWFGFELPAALIGGMVLGVLIGAGVIDTGTAFGTSYLWGLGIGVGAVLFGCIGGAISYRKATAGPIVAQPSVPQPPQGPPAWAYPSYPPQNPQGVPAPQTIPGIIYCRYCGEAALASARYCLKCGKPLYGPLLRDEPEQPDEPVAPEAEDQTTKE